MWPRKGHLRSYNDVVNLNIPRIRVITWSVKALLYVIRIALTRKTKWYQLEVCILFRPKVMIKCVLNWHSATLCGGGRTKARPAAAPGYPWPWPGAAYPQALGRHPIAPGRHPPPTPQRPAAPLATGRVRHSATPLLADSLNGSGVAKALSISKNLAE